MSVYGAWVLAPLVLTLLVVGMGLLAERISGWRLPGSILPAVGLAGIIVVAGPFTLLDATAELAVPVVAVLAAGGLALARPWRDPRLRAAWPWPLIVAAGAYAVFAAPSLLTGQGSIAGYTRLDDSSTWLAITDQVLSHGRDLSYLSPSSYQRVLETWLGGGYPVGSFLPVGASARLAGQDAAGAYQPTIAVYAAILGLGLFACARVLLRVPGLAAGAALVAVQASLFVGYAQWGGVKEAATAALLPALAMLAVDSGCAEPQRRLALLCLVAGGLLAILGVNGLVWAGPALAVAGLFVLARWRKGRREAGAASTSRLLLGASGLAALLGAASLPALVDFEFVRQTTLGPITRQSELGTLAKPLSLLQGAGLWPAADFRVDPDPRWAAIAFAAGGLVAAAACVILAARRRAWALLVLFGTTLAGAAVAVAIGSPWVDAKVLAELAPVLLLGTASLAAAGLAPNCARPVKLVSLVAAAALVVGCSWSTVAIIVAASVAPRERFAELREISGRIAGQGPTVVLDFESYADRHFLRDADPEGATDLRVRRVRRIDGEIFAGTHVAEVDQVATPDLWAYRTIVRRRSPVASRPPSAFTRRWAGRAFEVWQREPTAPPPLARLPLGAAHDPTGVPSCRKVLTLARTPRIRAIAAVARRRPVVVDLTAGRLPSSWRTGGNIVLTSDGQAELPVRVPAAGRWRLWAQGSVRGRLEARVDGRAAGSIRHELAHAGQWVRFAAVRIRRSTSTVELSYRKRRLAGAGGIPAALGPVALTPPDADNELPVLRLRPRHAKRLCDGRRYDWIEALP